METKGYRLLAAGGTDVGLVREANEDAWQQMPELQLYVLADGMGGHRAGDVAANEAVNRICNIVKRELQAAPEDLDLEEVQALIYDALQEVNEQIYQLGHTRRQLRGMGTTLCLLYFLRDWAVVGHVGDSRVYRERATVFEQLTTDHSLFQELVDRGRLDEGEEFERKHVITKAIGIDPIVEPSVKVVEVRPGDLFLLCSDGLSDLVSNSEIAAIVSEESEPEQLVTKLISAANSRGGIDNTTVVSVKVVNNGE